MSKIIEQLKRQILENRRIAIESHIKAMLQVRADTLDAEVKWLDKFIKSFGIPEEFDKFKTLRGTKIKK